jgi:adenine phosphoribosyltransferase
MTNMKDVASALRSREFKGVAFYDITSITSQGHLWKHLIDAILVKYEGVHIDKIVALDARGFFFSGALAYALGGIGHVPVRKQGKLPGNVLRFEFFKEYDSDAEEKERGSVGKNTRAKKPEVFEIQNMGDIQPGDRVLIVDDLLATGGSAEAACQLVEQVGGEVIGLAFAIELPLLGGRKKLIDYPITSEMSVLSDGKVYSNIRHCVDMIGVTPNNQLLLIERMDTGALAFPGGGIDPLQSIRQAAEREVPEETGYSCRMLDVVGTLADAHRDHRNDLQHISTVVTVEILGGKPRGENRKTRVSPWDVADGVLPGLERFKADHGRFLHGWWPENGSRLLRREAA